MAACIAALVVTACGSTSPGGPSGVSQYPSLVGASGPWLDNKSSVMLRPLDAPAQLGSDCRAQLFIDTQTDGAFAGSLTMRGVAPESDKRCTYASAFTAQMTAGGTISSFVLAAPFYGGSCTPMQNPSVHGTASTAAIQVELADRTTCDDSLGFSGPPRALDRTLTVSVRRP
jgi:hypothetical protein